MLSRRVPGSVLQTYSSTLFFPPQLNFRVSPPTQRACSGVRRSPVSARWVPRVGYSFTPDTRSGMVSMDTHLFSRLLYQSSKSSTVVSRHVYRPWACGASDAPRINFIVVWSFLLCCSRRADRMLSNTTRRFLEYLRCGTMNSTIAWSEYP